MCFGSDSVVTSDDRSRAIWQSRSKVSYAKARLAEFRAATEQWEKNLAAREAELARLTGVEVVR